MQAEWRSVPRVVWAVVLLAAAAGRPSAAAETPGATTERAINKATVALWDRANAAQAAADTNLFVRPGLRADRRTGQVVVKAEAARPDPPVEFFLIGEGSGKDYEALAVALARPGDVCQALTFIGMAPGRPIAPEQLCFWPKGERVRMQFRVPGSNAAPVAVEQFVLGADGKTPLPPVGLVFVGGPVERTGPGSNIVVYAVDAADPGSIATTYNEPVTVLDVPRQAPQSEVYGQQVVNGARRLPVGQLLDVLLEPENPDGRKRVLDIDLVASLPADRANPTPADVRFRMTDAAGTAMGADLAFAAARSAFGVLVKGRRDPFVSVRFADAMPLGVVRAVCENLREAEGENGIRVEPPPRGQLYYKAFLPREDFRGRDQRLMQPWELHLAGAANAPTGTLVQIEEVWKDDQPRPDLKVTEFAVRSGADVRRNLDERGPGLRVMLVYAPPTLTYGQLMSFVGPALATHPTVHVYLNPEP